VYRIDARNKPLPNDLHPFSSHAFGVTQAVELARRLKTLPPRLILFGVGAKSFDSGKGLSPEVERSKLVVTQMIIEEILLIVSQGSK
jgi:hydrogenase maturation protease